jgi:hypothetical protein
MHVSLGTHIGIIIQEQVEGEGKGKERSSHCYHVRRTPLVGLGICETPCSHEIAVMAAFVVDLRVVTHCTEAVPKAGRLWKGDHEESLDSEGV